MKLTYDRLADAAYLYLEFPIEGTVTTYCCDPLEVKGQIHLDFDRTGHLVGVEILDASKKLPAALLEKAEIIG